MKAIPLMLLVASLHLATTPARADSAATAEAEKLLQTMNMQSALQASMEQMLDVQIQQNPAMGPYRQVMQQFFQKHMSYQSLKPELVQIYAEAFSAQELAEINQFYTSQVGQKTIQKMPELMGKGARIGAARVQANIGELQAMIKAEAQRLEQQKSK